MKIITVGDNVCDCYLDSKIFYPGGNCVNVAVNVRRNGLETAYLGILGNDDKAEHLKSCLLKERVDISHCRYVLAVSGQPGVKIRENGDRQFVRLREDTAQTLFKIQLIKDDLEYIKQFELLHTSIYSSLDGELYKLKNLIDVSYDYSDLDEEQFSVVEQTAKYVKYAFLSASNLSDKFRNKVIDFFFNAGTEIVCITNGKNETKLYTKDQTYKILPKETNVVDTMGAGDSFIAGFLTKILESTNIQEAMEYATLRAKETCEIEGGFGYPHPLR